MPTTGAHGIIIPDPSTANAIVNQVRDLAIQTEAGLADVEATVVAAIDLDSYATKTYVDAALSGIGTSGMIQVGGAQPSEGWWLDTGTAPEPDVEVTPTGPTWTDDATNGGGTWTTPTQTGITYSPASGTADPGQLVTVTATALPGYVIIGGTSSWTHTFPTGPAAEPDWATLIASDDFERDDVGAGGLGTAPTGGAWSDPASSFGIASGRALNSGGVNGAIVTLPTVAGDVRVSAAIWFSNPTGQHGVVARANAAHDTYYHARINGSDSVQLYRAVGGALTSLGSHTISPAIAAGETHTLALRVWESVDTELRVDLDGIQVITATDSTVDRPTGTRVGLRGSTTAVRFDSITAHA